MSHVTQSISPFRTGEVPAGELGPVFLSSQKYTEPTTKLEQGKSGSNSNLRYHKHIGQGDKDEKEEKKLNCEKTNAAWGRRTGHSYCQNFIKSSHENLLALSDWKVKITWEFLFKDRIAEKQKMLLAIKISVACFAVLRNSVLQDLACW